MDEVEDPLTDVCIAISFVNSLYVSLAHFFPLISIDIFLID